MNSQRPNRYIGTSVPRVEDARLLSGRGCFTDDFSRPDQLHAAVLRSPEAHGLLRAIDADAARALPGVHAVITAADIGEVPLIPIRIAPLPGGERFLQPVIASERVRYVGEPLALVVADSRAIAEDALELIHVDIDSLPANVDATLALPEWETGDHLLFPEHGTNVASHYPVLIGDPDKAFADADLVCGDDFYVQRHTAIPMEPRVLLAEWEGGGGRLCIWGAAKVPFFNRRHLASMFGMEETDIELVELDVGGGFGVRGEVYPEDYLVPFAARLLGRPVKWSEDRAEHMLATAHSREVHCTLEIACRKDGTVLGVRGRVIGDMGAYISPTGGIVPSRVGQFLLGGYHVPALALEVRAVLTNKTPVGSYRGPGRFESNFFRERLFDIAARKLGIDPLEFRRRNIIQPEDMPYSPGKLVPFEVEGVYDSGDYPDVFERCVEGIGWREHAHLQGRCVDGRYHGFGIASYVDSSAPGPRENVRIVLRSDGDIDLFAGSSALGQGVATVLTQIAAETLSLPMERIAVHHGSTSLVSLGYGSFHSRATVMGGSAVLEASAKLLELIAERAAARFGVAPGEVAYAGGAVLAGGRETSLAEFAAMEGPLEVETGVDISKKTFSYGTHAAHVAVDPGTGHVEVIDYLAVEDVGRMINPMLVHGQKIGSIVQALGGVFLDHMIYDESGQPLTGSLADYLLPTADDFPNVRALALELHPSPGNPLGVKGAGEDGVSAVAGAVANAVANALQSFSVEPNVLPLTPSRIWEMIHGVSRADQPADRP